MINCTSGDMYKQMISFAKDGTGIEKIKHEQGYSMDKLNSILRLKHVISESKKNIDSDSDSESDSSDDEIDPYIMKEVISVVEKDDLYDKKVKSMDVEEMEDHDLYIASYTLLDNKITPDDCRSCGTKNSVIVDMSRGILMCDACCLIITEYFDVSAEWNIYDGETSDTAVRCTSGVSNNNFIPSETLKGKLAMLNNWLLQDHKERNMKQMSDMITNACIKEGINKYISDEIKAYYKKFSQSTTLNGSSTVRGINKNELAAAITFYICKEKGVPRLPEEIASMYKLNVSDVTHGFKTFEQLMSLKEKKCPMALSTAEQYLTRLVKKLEKNETFCNLSIRIAKNSRIIGIAAHHTPSSLAAASVLLAADILKDEVSLKKITEIFIVSKTTCEKTMKEIKKYINIITNDKKTLEVASIMMKEKRKFLKQSII